MATAQIVVNGTAGSRTDIEWNTTVSLTNNNNTGVSTWAWYLLSQPDGAPAVALTAPSTSTPSFIATKEGSYLIRLVVNAGLPTEASDQVVAAVRELETNDRIPAAGETTEVSSTEGWANTSLNRVLHLSTRTANNGIVGGVVDASVVGTLVAGTLLYVSGTSTLASGTSGERLVPAYSKALGTTQAHLSGALGILLGLVDGVGAASANDRIRVLMQGVYPSTVTMASGGAVGDKVYVSDTGTLSLVAGTISRQVGTVAKVVSPTTYQVFFSGYAADGAGSGAPSGPAGGVLTGTYPDPDGLQANASHIIPLSVGTGNVVGDPIAFKAQDGNASAPGSALTLQAGDATVVGELGGNLFLYAGNNTAIAGGTGGSVFIESGKGDLGTSGSVEINTKDAANAGNIFVEVGASSSSSGGDLSLKGGNSAAENGGSVQINAGNAAAASKGGGDVSIEAGSSGSGGVGGSVSILAGASSSTSGSINIETQNANNAGNISIFVGRSITNNGASLTLDAGRTSKASGIGGSAIFRGGGSIDGTNATGGPAGIYGGNASTADIGILAGSVVANGAINTVASKAGGSVTVQGGNVSALAAANSVGGNVQILGGDSEVSSGGEVTIQGGDSAAGAPLGGNVYIKGGNGGGVGNVVIDGKGAVFLASLLGGVSIARESAEVFYRGREFSGVTVQNIAAASNQILPNSPIVQLQNNTGGLITLGAAGVATVALISPYFQRVLLINTSANAIALQDDAHFAGTKLKLGANVRTLSTWGILELVSATNGTTPFWLETGFRG